MQEIERVAAILKPSETMLVWINAHLLEEEEPFELEEIQEDCTVILLPALEDEDIVEAYLNEICHVVFTQELQAWSDNESTWPKDRSLEVFLQWFDIEFHSLVYDCIAIEHVLQRNKETLQ